MTPKQVQQKVDASRSRGVVKSYPVPLYHQIFLLLRDDIISGQRPFGSLVPTEQELSEIFHVSRITTRRALDELAQNRLVERKRRIGTRVIFQPASPPIEGSIEQAVESLLVLGRKTRVKVIELVEEETAPPATTMLNLEAREMVVRAVRVRWLEDQPLGCVESYVPSRTGVRFTRADLESMPMLSLLKRAGLEIATAAQTISATFADAAMARLLDIEIRAPLLRISRTVYSRGGEAILFTLANYRADRYQIRLDLHSFGEGHVVGPSQGDDS